MTRSFTLPPKLNISTRNTPNPEIGAADGIETLYVHPAASIIKFNTGASRPGSSSGSPLARHGESSGTLPWAYPTEGTLAVGPMEIYRVPGSVSFLHSGALLHAILPRSQCWCVDGVSKFAFRVLPDTYYRIELPGETAEDLELVEALKLTFKKVLFYERTPCPFARGFTVDLPAEEVKIKKRNSVREGPAKKWRLQKAHSWKPEGWEEEELKRQSAASESRPGSGDRSEASDAQEEDEEEDEASDESKEEGQEEHRTAGITHPRLRPRALEPMRSVTAPSQMQAQSITPSRVRSRVQAVESVDRAQKAEKVRFVMEVERRSSVRAKRPSTAPVTLPPSPPDSSIGPDLLASDDASIPEEEETEIQTNEASEEEDAKDVGNPGAESELEDIALPAKTDEDTAVEKESSTGSEADEILPRSISQPRTPPGESEQPESELRDEVVQYDEDSLPRELAEISISSENQLETLESDLNSRMATPSAPEDPYAAIQARIQARRSIGGTTTSFHPVSKSPTRKENSSTASSVSLASQQRSNKSNRVQRQNSIAATLVNKAFAVFLGPPAHLVTMMLRIAARFSSGTFGSHSMFFVESPIGSPRRVPGSFYLEDEEDRGWKSEEEEQVEDWDEDDFGVPLRSPVRISGLRESARRHGWEME
jgi:hypothetical protein